MQAIAARTVGSLAVLEAQVETEQPIRRPRRQASDTRHLRSDQTSNLLNAGAFAERQATPLDVHVIVRWDLLGLVAERSILEQQAKFLDRLSKWLRRRRQPKPLAYVWTIEFSPWKGHHSHLVLSAGLLCPRDLGDLFRGLSKLVTGSTTRPPPGAIHVAESFCYLPYDKSKRSSVARSEKSRRGLIAYVCKGLRADDAVKTGIDPVDQGEVRLRRCGVSRSLDWSARRRAGWQEQTLNQFSFFDLPAKGRLGLEMGSQAPTGAPPSSYPDRRVVSDARTASGLYGPWPHAQRREYHEPEPRRSTAARSRHPGGLTQPQGAERPVHHREDNVK